MFYINIFWMSEVTHVGVEGLDGAGEGLGGEDWLDGAREDLGERDGLVSSGKFPRIEKGG